MKHTTKRSLIATLGLVAFIIVLGIAGTYEHSEQIVYNMPQEAYEAIVLKLGDGASMKDIANEYTENQSFYDSNYDTNY